MKQLAFAITSIMVLWQIAVLIEQYSPFWTPPMRAGFVILHTTVIGFNLLMLVVQLFVSAKQQILIQWSVLLSVLVSVIGDFYSVIPTFEFIGRFFY